MIAVYRGLVESKDPYRYGTDEGDGELWIGGVDVVQDARKRLSGKKVTVAFMDERFEGELSADLGWGYSEYTPMDPDRLDVGPHDIIKMVLKHKGEHVTLVLANEPFNVLDLPHHVEPHEAMS